MTVQDNTQLCSSEDYVLFTDVAKYLSWIGVTAQLYPSSKSGNSFEAFVDVCLIVELKILTRSSDLSTLWKRYVEF